MQKSREVEEKGEEEVEEKGEPHLLRHYQLQPHHSKPKLAALALVTIVEAWCYHSSRLLSLLEPRSSVRVGEPKRVALSCPKLRDIKREKAIYLIAPTS